MNRGIIILLLLFVLSCYKLYAGVPAHEKDLLNNTNWNFVENKGQVKSSKTQFYGHQGGVYLYCQPGKISFVFTKTENTENDISEATGIETESPFIRGVPVPTSSGGGFNSLKHQNSKSSKTTINRTDLILINSNPAAQIIASDKQEYYENYYTTGNADSGITNVRTYKTITYKDVYPYMDMVLHAQANGMKYEFIVHPGGKVSDIQMQWNGLENIKKLKNSGIEYSCSLGKMIESKPVSFQGENIVGSDFIKTENKITFKIGTYDKTKPLVIDPTLEWATYYSGDYSSSYGVATDTFGNEYITGVTASSSGIATNGAYQTSFAGGNNGYDAYIAKFNSKGMRIWATYYGGSGDDYGNAVATDLSGNIYISGTTSSNSGIATTGAYQTSFAKGNGIIEYVFLAKFDSSGAIKWATYFGGGRFDEGQGVATDAAGDVYISGATQSSGIATKGAYQSKFSSAYGTAYAFLAKFSGTGTIKWATYFGGGKDRGYGVTTDHFGNVFLTGGTGSDTGVATFGAYQTVKGYDEDAFLAKFSSGGGLQWATYFGGSAQDLGFEVAADASGNVYMTGLTNSDTGIAVNSSYQAFYGGAGDAFLAKFDMNGGIQWATYFGGNGQDVANGITVDEAQDVYIAGQTYSSTGIATSDGYQVSRVGSEDAFLAQFNSNGDIKWATHFAGSNTSDCDGGSGVAVDSSGHVFLTGNTCSGSGMATSGAYQTSSAGYHTPSAFLAKFSFPGNDAGIDSIFTPFGSVCKDSQQLVVSLKNFSHIKLDSVTINISVNGIIQHPFHWSGSLASESTVVVKTGIILLSVGTNKIKCWTSRPNGTKDSVPENDTSIIFVTLIPPPVINIGADTIICANTNISIGGTAKSGYSYLWSSYPNGFSSTVSNPNVNPSTTTKYYITVNATGCSNRDSITVKVNPLPFAVTGPNKSICFGDSVTIGDLAVKGDTYDWTSNPNGFNSTISNPVVNPQSSTTYTLSEKDTTTGCTNTHSVIITVNPLPNANTGQSNYQICLGTHIKIGANGAPHISYSWTSIPTGFSSTLPDPVVNPLNSTVYHLSVKDTVTGCVNKNSANIFVGIAHAPVADPGPNQTICYGDSVVIGSHAVAGNNYAWISNPPGFTSSKPVLVVSPDSTTSYLLTVTSSVGCTDFDSVIIKVNPIPFPFAGKPENLCSGTGILLGDSSKPGHLYAWASNPPGFSSTISNPIDSPKVTTEYYLKETISSTGCSSSDSVLINVVPKPNVNFDVKNINGFEYQFVVKNPNEWYWQYHWVFGDSLSGNADTSSGFNVLHTYSKNGKYNVVLTVSLPGFCTETELYQVVINEKFALNIFPNPFELQTDINYTLVNPGHVRISLTDEIGRQIGTLLDKQLSQGEYNTYFDAAKWNTRPAMYFVIFQLDDKLIVKKIVQLYSIYH